MFSALIISRGCANCVLLVLSAWPWPRRPVVPSLCHVLSLGDHPQCVRLTPPMACLACDLTKCPNFSSLRNCMIWRVSSLRWCLCVEASFCLRIQRLALLGKPKGLMRGCGSLRLILPTSRPVPTESMLSRAGYSAATARISCAWRLCALTLKARTHLCLASVPLTGRFLLALRLCILSLLPAPLLTLSNLHCLRVVSSCRSCSGGGFC